MSPNGLPPPELEDPVDEPLVAVDELLPPEEVLCPELAEDAVPDDAAPDDDTPEDVVPDEDAADDEVLDDERLEDAELEICEPDDETLEEAEAPDEEDNEDDELPELDTSWHSLLSLQTCPDGQSPESAHPLSGVGQAASIKANTASSAARPDRHNDFMAAPRRWSGLDCPFGNRKQAFWSVSSATPNSGRHAVRHGLRPAPLRLVLNGAFMCVSNFAVP